LELTSPPTIELLNPGESSSITISLTPSIDTPFGEFTGSVSVFNSIVGVSVNFRFYIVSNLFSTLRVFVEVILNSRN
jgi:hypothetical protein